MKDTFCFGGIFHRERDGKTVRRPLVTARRGVGTHQDHAVDVHARVHHLASPFCWHLSGHRGISKRKDRFDLAAEALFVKFKCLLALAVEYEIWIYLHFVLLYLSTTFHCNFCFYSRFEFCTSVAQKVVSLNDHLKRDLYNQYDQ